MAPQDAKKSTITVSVNGPYLVAGAIPIVVQSMVPDDEGNSRGWQESTQVPARGVYRLCRCGQSSNKPFCDNTHLRIQFDGTEVASREKYEDQAEILEGTGVDLSDAPSFCAGARFCDPDGGIWSLIKETSNPEIREAVKRMAKNCPSGRLVAHEGNPRKAVEQEFERSIGLVQDTAAGVSGPLWVRGGITIRSANGEVYEQRNRVTLCRCGASSNKPFCDGSHLDVKFQDGIGNQ